METYLVGGAVRDSLLGLEVKDMDWVVVGATPEQMLKNGFKQVGAEFPVFLHPDNGDEYALARKEYKDGQGYHGFQCDFGPEVSLKEDLMRRDLTVNAMAMDQDGQLIDYYGGARDLESRVLRHVSDAFAEDPLRVLRVARFAARYGDFTIADETLSLMRSMVKGGELNHLTAERVWKETSRALGELHPSIYFKTLHDCGALEVVFPEIAVLDGITQPVEHHPEGDVLTHVLLVVDQAAKLSDDPRARFAALVHDLGKGVTPREEWPRHIGHEKAGVPLVEAMVERLKISKDYARIGKVAAEHHQRVHTIGNLTAKKVVKLFNTIDAFRRPEVVEFLAIASEADAKGRTGLEDRPYPQSGMLRSYFSAVANIKVKDVFAGKGKDIKEASPDLIKASLHQARVSAIKRAGALMSEKSQYRKQRGDTDCSPN